MGFHTVRTGEQAVIWSRSGAAEVVEGPQRIFTFFKKFQQLREYRASQTEYLVVQYSDGMVEHHPGPCKLFKHPTEHSSVTVQQATEVASHEAVVTYQRCTDTDAVKRNIVRGPCIFFPNSHQWVHHFDWHGEDDRKGHIRPHANKFYILPLIESQFYYNVHDVRTRDDALIEVKVMIFYRVLDVEEMLDNTDDPIADFVNAACADIISFCAARSYEEFVEGTAALNKLETYTQLTTRANRVGFEITKVVYRGYHASDALQKYALLPLSLSLSSLATLRKGSILTIGIRMHNEAIRSRTELRLKTETLRQKEELQDMQLSKQLERDMRSRETEEEAILHRNRMLAFEHDEAQRQEAAKREAELQHTKALNAEKMRSLETMKSLGVDLTKYLTAQTPQPDKFIRIEGSEGHALHLHD